MRRNTDVNKQKTEIIKIVCTEKQKESIQKEADKRSISVSQFCLNAALDNKRNKTIIPCHFFATLDSVERKMNDIESLLNMPKNQRDEIWFTAVCVSFIESRREIKKLWGL